MVVGETGAGKTSLLSNLFHRKLDWPAGERTDGIKELTTSFTLQGKATESSVPFQAHLVDSPGWGELCRCTCVNFSLCLPLTRLRHLPRQAT
jgi:GTP-binding protein EngB required for normal cell division